MSGTLTDETRTTLQSALVADGPIVVLTGAGAGVSAESGIPTFRGPEGYWQVGSRSMCRAATTNPATLA